MKSSTKMLNFIKKTDFILKMFISLCYALFFTISVQASENNSISAAKSWQRWNDMYVRLEADGNLSCYAKNSRDCYRGIIITVPDNSQKLICGGDHKRIYGNTGYDQINHWCNNAYADIYSEWKSGVSSRVDTLVSKNAIGQPICFSQDGKNCDWGIKSRPANVNIRPLVCGEVHRKIYGTSGYDDPNHWCSSLRKVVIAITSDPQYPWKNESDILSSGNEITDSKISIPLIYNSINKFNKEKKIVDAVFINGDVTAFGHGWQWDYMLKTALPILTPPIYMGLGNHDYENNVNDCAQNGCIRNSLNAFERYLPAGANVDRKINYYYEFPNNVKEYRGSFAWSHDLGGVHFVFLNNEPTYSFEASGYNGSDARKEKFIIESAIPWLERDLSAARKSGKPIVLIYHKPSEFKGTNGITRGVFERIVKKYKVSLVLWGHLHSYGGEVDYFGGAPAIFSGSASTQTYLIAEFDMASETVEVSLSKGGNIQEMPIIGSYPLFTPSEDIAVTQSGYEIKFVNNGGYNAKFSVQYTTADGVLTKKSSSSLATGRTWSVKVPSNAINVRSSAIAYTGLVWNRTPTIFNLVTQSARCLKTYGTTISRKWGDC